MSNPDDKEAPIPIPDFLRPQVEELQGGRPSAPLLQVVAALAAAIGMVAAAGPAKVPVLVRPPIITREDQADEPPSPSPEPPARPEGDDGFEIPAFLRRQLDRR